MAGWLMDGGRVVSVKSGLTPSSQTPEGVQSQTARHSWLRGGLAVSKFTPFHCVQSGRFWADADPQSSAAAAAAAAKTRASGRSSIIALRAFPLSGRERRGGEWIVSLPSTCNICMRARALFLRKIPGQLIFFSSALLCETVE